MHTRIHILAYRSWILHSYIVGIILKNVTSVLIKKWLLVQFYPVCSDYDSSSGIFSVSASDSALSQQKKANK